MNPLSKVYHFLGGVRFAVLLIALTALFVVAGTFLESATQSHSFAAQFTYSHPAFAALLLGFFANIFLSSTRRWPWKKRHIPFLITHLGLLMILGGTLYKNLFGLQGTMGVYEGTGSQKIFLPDTYELSVQSRESSHGFPLKKHFWKGFYAQLTQGKAYPFADLEIELVQWFPHCREELQLWIHDSIATISGLPPFPTLHWDPSQPLQSPLQVPLEKSGTIWNLYGYTHATPTSLIQQLFAEQGTLTVGRDPHPSHTFSLKEVLQGPVEVFGSILSLTWSEESPLALTFHWKGSQGEETLFLPLEGEEALIPQPQTLSYLGGGPHEVSLSLPPSLLLSQDPLGSDHLALISPCGQVSQASFHPDQLHSLVVLDKGFGGYRSPATLTYQLAPSFPQARRETLESVIAQDLEKGAPLPPPLALLERSCKKSGASFPAVLVAFLEEMERSHSWIYDESLSLPDSLSPIFSDLSIESLDREVQQGMAWASALLPELEEEIRSGRDPLLFLSDRHWPMQKDLEHLHGEELLRTFTQQIYMLAHQLPLRPLPPAPQALSAFFRAYGLSFRQLALECGPPASQSLEIECPLARVHQPLPPRQQLELNQPLLRVKVRQGQREEIACLSYDPYGSGLKWPVLRGAYLLRFQPQFKSIPHRLRLRDAKQISYPGTGQAYSYEAEVIMTEKGQPPQEATLSMNHVYETEDGYRFYLSNLHPANESAVKQGQFAVNWDPAKYWVTYPGACVMALGIIGLFWPSFKRKKRGKKG